MDPAGIVDLFLEELQSRHLDLTQQRGWTRELHDHRDLNRRSFGRCVDARAESNDKNRYGEQFGDGHFSNGQLVHDHLRATLLP
jgi:hypothetical protein